jgi:hypothetical protein
MLVYGDFNVFSVEWSVFGYIGVTFWQRRTVKFCFEKDILINSLTPELNPSAQHCLTRFFTGDFVSLTVHFVNICVKNQQIHQLLVQFINYVW